MTARGSGSSLPWRGGPSDGRAGCRVCALSSGRAGSGGGAGASVPVVGPLVLGTCTGGDVWARPRRRSECDEGRGSTCTHRGSDRVARRRTSLDWLAQPLATTAITTTKHTLLRVAVEASFRAIRGPLPAEFPKHQVLGWLSSCLIPTEPFLTLVVHGCLPVRRALKSSLISDGNLEITYPGYHAVADAFERAQHELVVAHDVADHHEAEAHVPIPPQSLDDGGCASHQ